MHDPIAPIAEAVLAGQAIDRDQARALCALHGQSLYDLFHWANRIRLRFVGPEVKFCAIVAGKAGACSEDCKFCSQSAHYQTTVGGQSRLSDEQVLDSHRHAAAVGADSFGIVNSGRAPTRRELEQWLGPLLSRMARDGSTRVCATLGALTPQTAKYLHDCGVRRINHNLESGERFYPTIVTTHPYAERLRTLRVAREAGLSLCSGGIFGMGEAWEDRLDLLFALRDVGVDVMPINFLNPIPGTPLGHLPKLPPMECLQIIAIARFILPEKDLKVAGGREVCLRDLQSWMFYAGANSTMIGNYLTTYGRSPEADHQMIRDLGLAWRGYDGGGVEPAARPSLDTPVRTSGRVALPVISE